MAGAPSRFNRIGGVRHRLQIFEHILRARTPAESQFHPQFAGGDAVFSRTGQYVDRVVKSGADDGLGVFKEVLCFVERQRVIHHVTQQGIRTQFSGRLEGSAFHKIKVERYLVGQLDDLSRRLGFIDADEHNVDVRGVADERVFRQRGTHQERSHHAAVRFDPLGHGILCDLMQGAACNSHG
jgi:hypothetical protein